MKHIRQRLTYANVMSSIAVFLVLGGATAFAASQLEKNSVGKKQLKNNAVTTSKIKKNAVTAAKIKKNAVTNTKIQNNAVSGTKIQAGAVTGEKVADGSLTGADVNAGSMPFSQIVARLRNAGPANLETPGPVALGSYTQAAGEDDQYLAGLDINFAATCAAPRNATVYLLMDPANPAEPSIENVVAIAGAEDGVGGTVTKRAEFFEVPFGVLGGLHRMGPAAAQNHTFYVFVANSECEGGGTGITGSNLGLDVIGTK